MGYFVNITEVEWSVAPENEQGALAALRELDTHDEWKFGGTDDRRWFMWMPKPFASYNNLYDFLTDARFSVDVDDDGTHIRAFDCKHGQESLFLNALAPFVRPGSFIEWLGEDGDAWMFTFEEGKMFLSQQVKSWSDPKPVTVNPRFGFVEAWDE